MTPFHKTHSTELAGLHDNLCGDDRYYNNLVLGGGNMSFYNAARQPVWMRGNVFLGKAQPCKHEKTPLVRPDFDPTVKLVKQADGWYLDLSLDKDWGTARSRKLVTTEMLGKAATPKLPYERPDGSPLRLDSDYFGKARAEANPFPGPFELPEGGKQRLKVWPIGRP
jgi:alpha-N-arabinofuranosidase